MALYARARRTDVLARALHGGLRWLSLCLLQPRGVGVTSNDGKRRRRSEPPLGSTAASHCPLPALAVYLVATATICPEHHNIQRVGWRRCALVRPWVWVLRRAQRLKGLGPGPEHLAD